MLDKDNLEKIAERIPAKTKYAVIASWAETEETAETWDDLEHVGGRVRRKAHDREGRRRRPCGVHR